MDILCVGVAEVLKQHPSTQSSSPKSFLFQIIFYVSSQRLWVAFVSAGNKVTSTRPFFTRDSSFLVQRTWLVVTKQSEYKTRLKYDDKSWVCVNKTILNKLPKLHDLEVSLQFF